MAALMITPKLTRMFIGPKLNVWYVIAMLSLLIILVPLIT